MTMTWMEALKQYNKGRGTWCIPRKGSAENARVRDMMRGVVTAAPKITLTQGEKTYASSIGAIEQRENVKALARRVRPLSRRGV